MSNAAPPPVPGSPSAAPARKGMSPWAWVGIGCGAMIVIGLVGVLLAGMFVFKKGKEIVEEATGNESLSDFVEDMKTNPAKVAAETMIRVNPELELISSDDDAGTITFRNTKTGEEATLNFEDIAEGRFSMKTSEGEYSIEAAEGSEGGVTFKGPESEARFGAGADLSDVPDWVPRYPGAAGAQGTFHSSSAESVSGAFTSQSPDSVQTVIDHYKQVFADGGYTVGTESVTKTGEGAYAVVTGERAGRSVNVVVIEQADGSQIAVNYSEKKP